MLPGQGLVCQKTAHPETKISAAFSGHVLLVVCEEAVCKMAGEGAQRFSLGLWEELYDATVSMKWIG